MGGASSGVKFVKFWRRKSKKAGVYVKLTQKLEVIYLSNLLLNNVLVRAAHIYMYGRDMEGKLFYKSLGVFL